MAANRHINQFWHIPAHTLTRQPLYLCPYFRHIHALLYLKWIHWSWQCLLYLTIRSGLLQLKAALGPLPQRQNGYTNWVWSKVAHVNYRLLEEWGYKVPQLSPPSRLTLHCGKQSLVLLFSLKALSSPRLSSDKKNIILCISSWGKYKRHVSLPLFHDASRACLFPKDQIFQQFKTL